MGIITYKRLRGLKTTILDALPDFRLGHQDCIEWLLPPGTNDHLNCDSCNLARLIWTCFLLVVMNGHLLRITTWHRHSQHGKRTRAQYENGSIRHVYLLVNIASGLPFVRNTIYGTWAKNMGWFFVRHVCPKVTSTWKQHLYFILNVSTSGVLSKPNVKISLIICSMKFKTHHLIMAV